jgi:hypothetical protein
VIHPLERWPRSGRRPALIAAIVAALAMEVLLVLLDAPLRDTGDGTIALEVAGSPERADEIIEGWRAADVLANGAFLNGVDLLSPLLYVAALAGACVAAAAAWRRRGRPGLAAAGIVTAWLVTAAGVFDWVENIALAVVILDDPAAPWPQIALAAAIPKFAGTTIALLYALVGGAPALIARRPAPSA